MALVTSTFDLDFTGRVFAAVKITTIPYCNYSTMMQKMRGLLEVSTLVTAIAAC